MITNAKETINKITNCIKKSQCKSIKIRMTQKINTLFFITYYLIDCITENIKKVMIR
jgi:hypothetical protein